MTGNLLTRDDTLLGICEGWGEDLGIHANWLRVGLAALVLWNPLVMIGLYAAMGVTLVATRLILRSPAAATTPVAAIEPDAAATAEVPLPLAA